MSLVGFGRALDSLSLTPKAVTRCMLLAMITLSTLQRNDWKVVKKRSRGTRQRLSE